ncbi:hypothetical protein, partial [Proteus mirabilis]|uniref:hypothetical protein n=1 Tax=Proteus mirabilis TaxID=584 RepID=UPI0023B7CFA9
IPLSSIALAMGSVDGIPELLAAIEMAGLIWGVVTFMPVRFAEPIMQRLGYAERSRVLVCLE